jgi:hypothetical protein
MRIELDILVRANVSAFLSFSLTADEEAFAAPMQAAIGRFADESLARFVTWEWELSDKQFSTFAKPLEQPGLQKFFDFWQKIDN